MLMSPWAGAVRLQFETLHRLPCSKLHRSLPLQTRNPGKYFAKKDESEWIISYYSILYAVMDRSMVTEWQAVDRSSPLYLLPLPGVEDADGCHGTWRSSGNAQKKKERERGEILLLWIYEWDQNQLISLLRSSHPLVEKWRICIQFAHYRKNGASGARGARLEDAIDHPILLPSLLPLFLLAGPGVFPPNSSSPCYWHPPQSPKRYD